MPKSDLNLAEIKKIFTGPRSDWIKIFALSAELNEADLNEFHVLLLEGFKKINGPFAKDEKEIFLCGIMWRGRPEDMEFLIDKEPDLSANHFLEAIERRGLILADEEIVKNILRVLLRNNVDINARFVTGAFGGKTIHSNGILVNAVLNKKIGIVEFLLNEGGVDIDAKDDLGRTAFMIASEFQNQEAAELLLRAGANIDAVNNAGFSALMNAVSNDKKDEVEFLIRMGANINATNDKFHGALFIAARSPQKDMFEFLLNQGADIDAKDTEGRTPLMLAILDGEKDVADLLLSKEADLDTEDNFGTNLLMLAAAELHSEADEDKKNTRREIFESLLKKRKPRITKEEIEQQIKLGLAKVMLNLTYSKQDLGITNRIDLAGILSEALPHLDLPSDRRDLLKEILEKISNHDNFFGPENQMGFRVFNTLLTEHQSYYAASYDSLGCISSVYYIDGNKILEPTDIGLREIDRKLEQIDRAVSIEEKEELYKSLLEVMSKTKQMLQEKSAKKPDPSHRDYCVAKFAATPSLSLSILHQDMSAMTKDYDEFRNKELFHLVETHCQVDASGNSIIERIIPAKPQSRGTCAWKSLSLLIQTILQEVYGKEIKLDADGKLSGEGYEIYKQFKHAFIKYYAAQIVEMADPKNSGKVFHQEACEFLKEVIKPNAERKIARNAETQDSSAFQTAASIRDRIAEYEKRAQRVKLYDERPWRRVEVAKLSTDKSLSISLKESVLALLKDLGGNYAKEAAKMEKKKTVGIMESDIAIIEVGNPASKRAALVKLNEKYQEAEKKFQQNSGDKNTMVELMALNLLLGKDHKNYLGLKKKFLKDQTPATSEIQTPLAHNVTTLQRSIVTAH